MSAFDRATNPRPQPLAAFFVLAYCLSWGVWAPAVLASMGWIGSVPARELHLAGGLGPLVAAVAVTWHSGGRGALLRLGTRCFVGGAWVIVAVLVPAVLFLVAAVVGAAVSGEIIDWKNVGASTELPQVPRPLYWLANLVCYGFGEEVGWRGFALPRLQGGRTALRASVILAIGWAGWHLPLFVFSPGLSALGVPGSIGWLFSLCLGSVLLTWLFNSSGGSIAAVALFHAALDVFITSPVLGALPNVMGALLTIGTLLLIPVYGGENLARRPRVRS